MIWYGIVLILDSALARFRRHPSTEPDPSSPPSTQVYATPTLKGDLIFVASHDKKLHALYAETGMPVWTFTTGGRISASSTVSPDGAVVYVGSLDMHVYAIRAFDGKEVWRANLDAEILAAAPKPSLDGKLLFVGTDEPGQLIALHTDASLQCGNSK